MKKFFKKLLSNILVISLISNLLVLDSQVIANANPWTIQKAEHLARRALI